MQKQKLIKPKVDILSVEPQYIDKFWPLCDFMVAEALQYSGGFASAHRIIATGKKRHLWEDKLVSTVSKFAKINGCKKLSFWCRPGWARVSKKWGWKIKHMQMERDL
jgi:hypothetical protein